MSKENKVKGNMNNGDGGNERTGMEERSKLSGAH